MILAVDYRPIFETALTAITTPYSDENLKSAIAMIAKEASAASNEAAGLRHDLVGRVFHRVLDTAKFDGSFYTSTAAASLLAGLAIRAQTLPDNLGDMRVIDPACGTGTLLMAVSERIKELLPPPPPQHITDNSRALIEQVITGIDVNISACHLAATTLGLLSPTTLFSKMNIYRALLGPESEDRDADVRLGSLELLASDTLDGMPWAITAQVDAGVETAIVDLAKNSFDLVIMNPPYTRDSLRHDQFSSDVEKKLKSHEKKLMEGTGAHGSGNSSLFLVLGEHLTKLRGGAALAAVLPLVAATNRSGARVRELISEYFHIEYVITSHDPYRFQFSENTQIAEMLVVARRHQAEPEDQPPTKFVNLEINPDRPDKAIALAAALNDDKRGARKTRIFNWPADRVAKGNWTPVLWLDHTITNSVYEMRHGLYLSGGMTTINTICEVGPAGQRIRDAYLAANTGSRTALWQNDVTHTNTMRPLPDTFIEPKSGKEHLADKYWNQRSRLMISEKPWLTTNHVLAICLTERSVGSKWIPVRPRRGMPFENFNEIEKAICVWLNSSPGSAALLGSSDRHNMSRFHISLDTIRSTPIPRFTSESAESLSQVFDDWADETPKPLAGAVECRVRRALDDAVIAHLGADPDAVVAIREALAAEPSVTGRRAQ